MGDGNGDGTETGTRLVVFDARDGNADAMDGNGDAISCFRRAGRKRGRDELFSTRGTKTGRTETGGRKRGCN
jgi:hypothetical protein